MTLRQLIFFGDSTTQGTGPVGETASIAQGGQGNWAELVAERLANLSGVGPLVSSGFRSCHLGLLTGGDNEWVLTGSFTAVTTNDAFDKCPYGHAQWGNGSAQVYTFTRPTTWRAAVGFALYYVDKAGGGNWQYRIDGGTYTNMNQTLLGDNKLAKFYVSTPSSFSTVDIRCYNGTVGVNTLVVGIEVFYLPPSTTQGLIVHNPACNGERLNNLVGSVAGDRMAFVDNVKLGTGAISNTPNAGVIIMHLNDTVMANTTTWANNLTTFFNRVSPFGPVGLNAVWEAAAPFTVTDQANYRAQAKTTAASLGAKNLDLYDVWSRLGFTANAGAVAAGFLTTDNIHESQVGHLDIAERMYWFVRNEILGLGTLPTTYPVTSKQSAVAYGAKNSTVAYRDALPVFVK